MAFIKSGKVFDKRKHYGKMKQMMENMDIVQYPLRIPTPLHHQVRMKLAQDKMNLRQLLICMLLNYVEK